MKLQKHSARLLEYATFLCITFIIVRNVTGLSNAPPESEEIPVNLWEDELINEEDMLGNRKSFGETCNHRIQCKVSEDLSCRNGSCVCSSPNMIFEASDSSEISYTTTRRLHHGRRSGCVMKAGQQCKFRVITDKENDRETLERLACVQNSRCDGSGVCACKNGFYSSLNGTCERLKSFGEECSYNAQCSKSAQFSCVANVCNCDPATAVYNSYSDKCLGIVGSSCSDSSECMSGAECYSQQCVCSSGFFETVNKKCIPMIPLDGICTSHSQCYKDSFTQKPLKCVNGTCSCDPLTSIYIDDNYLTSDRNLLCAPKLGQPCILNMCAPNLICDDSGVCQCRPDLVKSKSGLDCVNDLGGSCITTSHCAQGLTCNDGQCSCRYEEQEYMDHNCRFPVQGPCTSDDNCDVNAICNFETNTEKLVGHCTCKSGYVESTRGFCKTDFNATCYSSKECDDVANLRCISNLCQCPSHSEYNLEKRQCLKLVGGQCNNVDECISGTICYKAHLKVPGKCTCKVGFLETDQYGCVKAALLYVKDDSDSSPPSSQEYQ